MLYIEEYGDIRLTRGDSAIIEVTLTNKMDDSPYELKDDDKLTMTVRKTPKHSEVVFTKTLTGSSLFRIDPEDTNTSRFGRYTYDVQLTTATGEVYTVVEPTLFEIMPEVSY